MMKYLLLLCCFFFCTPASQAQHASKHTPVLLIMDTDIGPDYDDVGAMAVLHCLADKGEVKPLAVMASNKNEWVGPTIDVLNTYFGRPNLPVGVPKSSTAPDQTATQGWPAMIVKKYPHRLKTTADAPDAVMLYRRILASHPDASVTIVTTGFFTNLTALLDSKPDKISRLNGRELVAKKVKLLVSMAGAFPHGREYNVFIDSTASAKVCKEWPGSILFSGYEIGAQIKTGPRLVANKSLQSPVKDVFAWCMPMSAEDHDGRMSWDQSAVLVAIRGTAPYFGIKRGRIIIDGGNNSWEDDPAGPHAYLTEKMPFAEVTAVIETMMMHKGKK
ncbi:nucleoside hydrolase [Chitinophaga sp. 212800010-3]|uniref:nucleoside hydrolase n=1 Tax=unclassified Chitinophaga TaxID=2619133 RepID=UPI002DEAB2A9|nr:Nucleoside hydrolase [Chitinophaga sp. 212800010-3]